MGHFGDFVYWAFLAIISGASVYGSRSLVELNIKMAVVIEKLGHHENRIESLEEKI